MKRDRWRALTQDVACVIMLQLPPVSQPLRCIVHRLTRKIDDATIVPPSYALLAPARTPKSVINTIYAAYVKVLQQPGVKQRLDAQGVDIIGSTPEELSSHIKSEIAKWAKVIKAAKVRAD